MHTIEQARECRSISRVVVSTDDAEIASVARSGGAEVVIRPSEISGDQASSESALLHVLDSLKAAEGYDPDAVVFLQATSPIRRPGEIQAAIGKFIGESADSLFSAHPFTGFLWREEGGRPASFSYDFRSRPRRQDAPRDFRENGSIYIFKPWVLRKHNNRLGGRIAMHVMSEIDSLDIDGRDDLEFAAAVLAMRRPARDASRLAGVRLLALDFDGVMTDNAVWTVQDGTEAVRCDRGDGYGIGLLRKAGLEVVVVSSEENPVVSARCRKLGIRCIQGVSDKVKVLAEETSRLGIGREAVAYVGNDVNDLDAMRWAGTAIAVADAHSSAISAAVMVTVMPGGRGAVREVAEWILEARGSKGSAR